MAGNKFERIEKKFWMTEKQFNAIMPVILEHMTVDEYGLSKICNIYCDSDDYALIRRSIEAPPFKEKLRIRSYGEFEADKKVYVEIKRKVNGIGYKRRIHVPFRKALELLEGNEIMADNQQIEGELHEFVRRYRPKPKVYLSYERFAMYGKEDPELRMTVDQKIRYAMYSEDMDFFKEGTPIIKDESMALLEIKSSGAVPLWLTEQLSRLAIYQASFSKIGTCFTNFIAPQLKFLQANASGKRITTGEKNGLPSLRQAVFGQNRV